ncbi:MAG TPA: PEP-CTERM sorting domain-containing protein [Burkholderiaceae bacterium]|nr:PEP-CTERM sorting domain-containing protein [Burkholderiaceae bacterium]
MKHGLTLAAVVAGCLVGTANAADFAGTFAGAGGTPLTGLLDWSGTLAFETSGLIDGQYVFDQTLGVSLTSNLTMNFHVLAADLILIDGQVVDYGVLGEVDLAGPDSLRAYGSGVLFLTGGSSESSPGSGQFGGIALQIGSGAGFLTAGLSRVAPVPEPQTYAMFILGLSVLGLMVRPRKA